MRKYILLFGKIFSEIDIERKIDGEVTQVIRVPVVFGDKDPWLSRVMQDPNLDKETAIQLPRMSFVYTDFGYDGARKLPSRGIRAKRTPDPNNINTMWNEVPWDIYWSLYILTDTAADGAKIVEQIFPQFMPDKNFTVELIPEMDIVRDIPITLTGVDPYPAFDGSYEGRRLVGWELKFVMHGYFYGPVIKSPIIKFTTTNTKLGSNMHDAESVMSVTGTPGLTANGEPTSNPDLSIDPLLINWDDAWGFAERHSRG